MNPTVVLALVVASCVWERQLLNMSKELAGASIFRWSAMAAVFFRNEYCDLQQLQAFLQRQVAGRPISITNR